MTAPHLPAHGSAAPPPKAFGYRQVGGLWQVYKIANGNVWCLCFTARRAALTASALNARAAS